MDNSIGVVCKEKQDMTQDMTGVTSAKWELRKLGAPDVFLMVKILGLIGIKELAPCFEDIDVKAVSEGDNNIFAAVGISVAFKIADIACSNVPKAEQHIYQLLSNLSGLSIDEVSEDAVRFMEMIVALVHKPEFKDFFKVASKLLS